MAQRATNAKPPQRLTRWWRWGSLAAAAITATAAVFIYRGWSEKSKDQPVQPPTAATGQLPANLGPSWSQMDDPSKDGWDTEVLSGKATKTLKELAKVLSHPAELNAEQLKPFLSEDFSCGPLRSAAEQVVHDDPLFQVIRESTGSLGPTKDQSTRFRRAQGLVTALRSLSPALADAHEARWFFKLFRIEIDGNDVTTHQYVALAVRTKEGMVEQNATWRIRWQKPANGDRPRLRSIEVIQFEQVTRRLAERKLFTDCARAILARNDCYKKQFLKGMNHWFQRIQDTRYFSLLSFPGVAVGDVNGDGLEDLYVCQDESMPNRLFLQQPDGSAVDVSAQWEVDWLHSSRSALLVDLDNDGDQDLVVAMVGHLVVASNEGARFKVRALLATDDDTMSLCAADYDGDGDVDLFVCTYYRTGLEVDSRSSLPGGGATSGSDLGSGGGPNTLFRNDLAQTGRWDFADVTKAVGMDVENNRYSFAAAWEDYDNDGDQDLYVANDYGRNCLYRNDNGRFTEVSKQVGADDSNFGMSVAWGDYNRDGWMDLYVSNMFSAAGNRITFQDQFQRGSANLKKELQRFARGNSLLKNKNGTFIDVSETAAVTIGRWAWGSNFVDVNNDGNEDLVVANGYLTTDDSGDL